MRQPDASIPPGIPDWQALEELMAAARRNPGEFRTPAALAAAAGLTPQGLEAAFLRHVHARPEAFLEAARVDAACRHLLDAFGPPERAGEACGFFGMAAFRAAFRRHTGMTPARYQALGQGEPAFTLDLPAGYRIEDVLAYHGRDPLSHSERVDGGRLLKAFRVDGADVAVDLAFGGQAVKVRLHGGGPADPVRMGRVHRRVVRMLGLASDPGPFEAFTAAHPAFRDLVAPRSGLRIPLTADVWECLVWAILGQQVNLAFAYTLRRRLTEACGGEAPFGLRAHPGPRAVAALDPAVLAPLQFSRGKAAYLVAAARETAAGRLPLEALPAGTATGAEARLRAQKGVGPWTAHYVLMRGCGFQDCVPLGDAGLTAALQRHHALDHRPGPAETAGLMAPYAPHRSLATFHLWASLKGVPA